MSTRARRQRSKRRRQRWMKRNKVFTWPTFRLWPPIYIHPPIHGGLRTTAEDGTEVVVLSIGSQALK